MKSERKIFKPSMPMKLKHMKILLGFSQFSVRKRENIQRLSLFTVGGEAGWPFLERNLNFKEIFGCKILVLF